MKTLNVPLDDQEFEELLKKKGNRTWKEFLFELKGKMNYGKLEDQDNETR